MEIHRRASGDEAQVAQATPLFDHAPHAAAVRAFLADPSCYLLVANVDAQPAGFVRAHELRRLEALRPQVLLYAIGVAPGFRRRGVGRGLLEALKTICRARGAAELFVITNAGKAPAMAQYQATGGQREAADDVVFVYLFA